MKMPGMVLKSDVYCCCMNNILLMRRFATDCFRNCIQIIRNTLPYLGNYEYIGDCIRYLIIRFNCLR